MKVITEHESAHEVGDVSDMCTHVAGWFSKSSRLAVYSVKISATALILVKALVGRMSRMLTFMMWLTTALAAGSWMNVSSCVLV